MLNIIYLDKNNPYWTEDAKLNEAFVNCNINYTYDLLEARGYMYLNQVYEIFGDKLDPKEYNFCFRAIDDCRRPRFSYQRMEDNWIKICVIY